MSDFTAALLFQGPCQKNTHNTNYEHVNHIPIKDHAFHRPGTKRKEPAMGKALPNSLFCNTTEVSMIFNYEIYLYFLYMHGLAFVIFDKKTCLPSKRSYRNLASLFFGIRFFFVSMKHFYISHIYTYLVDFFDTLLHRLPTTSWVIWHSLSQILGPSSSVYWGGWRFFFLRYKWLQDAQGWYAPNKPKVDLLARWPYADVNIYHSNGTS